MSDSFELRLKFLQQLKTLNASQPSIQKLVSFCVKHGAQCGEDLWECVLEQTQQSSLNTRINILYFLDSLCDLSIAVGPPDAPYLHLIAKDLAVVVKNVVPDSREGVLNLMSAKQILESWRTRRVIDPSVIDEVLASLENRKLAQHTDKQASSSRKRGADTFSRSDILKRMEEDRERHKRLRERIWILPIPSLSGPSLSSKPAQLANLSNSARPSPSSPFTPKSPSQRDMPPPASTPGATGKQGSPPPTVVLPSALDIEFEQTWETTSDFNDDDLDRIARENELAGFELVKPMLPV